MTIDLKKKELLLLQRKVELQEKLPFLYKFRPYSWQQNFINANGPAFIVAANQIGKSTCQIIKCLRLCFLVDELWPNIWKTRPALYWYLYPTKDVIDVEFLTKWMPWMPQGAMKKSSRWGWEVKKQNNHTAYVHFNTGVILAFKTYSQNVQDLQSSSPHAVFCDEELPYAIMPEINARLFANPTLGGDPMFNMVFTATLGQEEWRRTMEEEGEKELNKNAFKQQISMYDCLHFHDGTPSDWTKERIQRIIDSCASEAEIQRRVFGKFVISDGLIFNFDRGRNITEAHPLPQEWITYVGIDIGSGGKNHPAAICFCGVNPERTKVRIYKGWIGQGEITTAKDILDKYREMKYGITVTGCYYDFSAVDFGNIATTAGETVNKADKARDKGQNVINTLLKTGSLKIYEKPELEPLVREFCTLTHVTPKQKAKDDFADAARYALSSIWFDWAKITDAPVEVKKEIEFQDDGREGRIYDPNEEFFGTGFEEEIELLNDLYEGSE